MNRSTSCTTRFAAALLVVAAGVSVRADDPVHSRWRTGDVLIDGVTSDWPEQTFISKEVSTSVVNDDKDLYLLVATADPRVILQLKRAGLMVYLDPKGGRGQTFGVRIPPLGSRLEPANIPLEGQATLPILSYFDVIGPGRDDLQRVHVDEGAGIDLRVGTAGGAFFLELRVPFVTGPGRQFAPGIELTRGEVGLGIVTPEPPRVARPAGRGGRGGGMIIGGGGAPNEPKGKDVEVWTKILLAKR
jgi:hypothetical protein